MNLQKLIEQYVTFCQTLGERCVNKGRMLRAFGKTMAPSTDVTEVCVEQVSAFLTGDGPITSAWHIKHDALLGFYRYAVSRGYVSSAPMPAIIPKRPPSFVPYIYSHEELRRLLDATESYQRNRSCMEPITMRTIVLLLYGTGLRVHEAVALNRADVEFDRSLLVVRHTKFFKTRLVPFGLELSEVLIKYSTRHGAADSAFSNDAPFFTTRKGTRVNQGTVESCFRRMCNHAGIRRFDGARYQPRLHDLRHSFAVHRLTSWYKQGADVQKLLPHLSVYLGHAYLAATQVYLSMTPELLHEASLRFQRYYGKEDRHD